MVIYRKYINCSSEHSFALRVYVEMAENVWEEWEYCLNANARMSGQVVVKEVKAIPIQAWRGPEGSRNLKPSHFKIISI